MKIRRKAESPGLFNMIKIELLQFSDEDRKQAGVKLGQAQPLGQTQPPQLN